MVHNRGFRENRKNEKHPTYLHSKGSRFLKDKILAENSPHYNGVIYIVHMQHTISTPRSGELAEYTAPINVQIVCRAR